MRPYRWRADRFAARLSIRIKRRPRHDNVQPDRLTRAAFESVFGQIQPTANRLFVCVYKFDEVRSPRLIVLRAIFAQRDKLGIICDCDSNFFSELCRRTRLGDTENCHPGIRIVNVLGQAARPRREGVPGRFGRNVFSRPQYFLSTADSCGANRGRYATPIITA